MHTNIPGLSASQITRTLARHADTCVHCRDMGITLRAARWTFCGCEAGNVRREGDECVSVDEAVVWLAEMTGEDEDTAEQWARRISWTVNEGTALS